MLIQVTRKVACHERTLDSTQTLRDTVDRTHHTVKREHFCAELFHNFDYISLVLQKSKKSLYAFSPIIKLKTFWKNLNSELAFYLS